MSHMVPDLSHPQHPFIRIARYSFRLVDLPHPPRREKEGALDRFEIADDPLSDVRLEWVVIHENIDLAYKSHYRVIHGLARIKNAFWGSAVRVGASSA